jgi:hypothetical protein
MLIIQVTDTRGKEWYWRNDLRVTGFPIKAKSLRKTSLMRAIMRAIMNESAEGVPVYVEDTEETIKPFKVKLAVLEFLLVKMNGNIPEPMYAYKNTEDAMNSIFVEENHWSVKVAGEKKFIFEGTQLKSGKTFYILPVVKRD